MPQIDHIGIPAKDPRSSAYALAEILGAGQVTTDGADDDMYRVNLDGGFVLFSEAKAIPSHHMAFRVTAEQFAGVIQRLKQRGIPFGNDPEDSRNGQTNDLLGGAGRVYWVDENGHLFEATC